MSHAPDLDLPVSSVMRVLVAATASFCALGLLAELAQHLGGARVSAVGLLSLSYEGNLPSWYASALPLLCAGLLAWIAAGERHDRRHWWVLALGFCAISIDEAVGFHERLSGLFDTSGVLHFDWVIPAGALVIALGAYFLGFLRRLDRGTARRFVVAGGLYVTGAVLFELPLGWWTERHGDDSLGYALIDWCEETLEFVGLTMFAAALLARLRGRRLGLTPRVGAPTR